MGFWRLPKVRWIVLLAAAALWRLILFIGPQGSDDFVYSAYAHDLSRGQLHIVPSIHELRFGFVGPIALCYALFGVSSLSLVAFNLVSSVAEVALTYGLAREFSDEDTSWRAAWIIAILPLEVFFATEAHTDVPLAALCSAALLVFLRARNKDHTWGYFLSGLLLGLGHLVKETAFLELAAFAVLAGRPRLRPLAVLGGFSAVLLAECIFFAAATGHPFYRIHSVASAQAEIMSYSFYESTSPTLRRTLVDFPALLFWPGSVATPFLSFLPFLAAAGSWMAIRQRLPERLVFFWCIALLVLLNFWPSRLIPYRPAMVAHPRILLVCTPPMAILASCFLGRISLSWARIVGFLFLAVALGNGLIVYFDGRRQSEGARRAFAALPQSGAVVSDPRTRDFLRFYDGYRDRRLWMDWESDPPSGDYIRVVNDTWISFLQGSYGVQPPKRFSVPAAERILEAEVPGRLRIRPLLQGRIERSPAQFVKVERVSPER
jgi:4-amino-4-deoxy-L-arabinose transferase-like glycosyltransferase